jgi:hypothetical protein
MIGFLTELVELAKRDGAVFAAVVAGFVSIVLAILNPITNWLVSRAGSLREIRSRYRQQWIDQFREDASKLVGNIQAADGGHPPELGHSQINEVTARLILRLNPYQSSHNAFEQKIKSFVRQHPEDTREAQDKRYHEFLSEAQKILKPEWDKVKKGK